MGTITSVHVKTDPHVDTPSGSMVDVKEISEDAAEQTLAQHTELDEGGGGGGENREATRRVLELRLSHSLHHGPGGSDLSREEEMGRTIQYLAEDSVRLTLANRALQGEVAELRAAIQKNETKDLEIFGETPEQKVARFEKMLQNERREKWEAIEKCERIRVDLVNCEKELYEKAKTIGELRSELDKVKRQTETRLTTERLTATHPVTLPEERHVALPCSLTPLAQASESYEEDSLQHAERRNSEMERFRAELGAKREARQKALAALSLEMNQLRDQLEAERALRMQLLNSTDPNNEGSVNELNKENQILKQELNTLTEDVKLLRDLQSENKKLKGEVQQFHHEVRNLNTLILQLKNDCTFERRKHDRVLREKTEIEEENERNIKSKRDLESDKERMWEEYDREKEEINKRTTALKEVIEISRQMLAIREAQVQELKVKLKDIEEAMGQKRNVEEEVLKTEYEKQLQNIKTLRELYEERLRLMEAESLKLRETIAEHTTTIENQKSEIAALEEKFKVMTEELDNEKNTNENMNRELGMSRAKSRNFENELRVMNTLFTQMLLGPYNTGSEGDLDKLTELLRENHDLITEMTRKEDDSEISSALPKLLLDLITQVDGKGQFDFNQNCTRDKPEDPMMTSTDTISEQSETMLEENPKAILPILSYRNATVFKDPTEQEDGGKKPEPKPSNLENTSPAVQEIATNLPKVWKVLMELLSHHAVHEEGESDPQDDKPCYKSVETPNGPRSVISVSKTFIRLKDLILEKKSLQRELTRLKQLNSHLEGRLDDQEKRLSQVQSELHKTWGVVGRMRAQHQQLHNHEKILRYELQEKRVMLSELKQELEYCRDKWERARQKNNESETEWRKLRREFAARKIKGHQGSNLNDSGESGFSDEQSGEEADHNDADRSSTESPVPKEKMGEKLKEGEITNLEVSVDGTGEVKVAYSLAAQAVDQAGARLSEIPEEGAEDSAPSTSTGAIPKAVHDDENRRRKEAREARLKRLEDQCQLLVQKVDITTHKSNFLSNRLEELHEQYGSTDEGNSSQSAGDAPDAVLPEGESRLQEQEQVEMLEECLAEATVQEQESRSLKDLEERTAQVVHLEDECTSEVESAVNERLDHVICSESTHIAGLDDIVILSMETSEMLDARTWRLERLENECRCLADKADSANHEREALLTRLEELQGECPDQGESNDAQNETNETLAQDNPETACARVLEGTPTEEQNKENVNETTPEEQSASCLPPLKPRSELTFDELMEARAARLQRLEEQCKSLVGKVTNTVQRSQDMSNRLGEIHEDYMTHEARQGGSGDDKEQKETAEKDERSQ